MNICVFCSSSNGVDEVYFDVAEKLGILIASGNHSLIYGGANVGLMEKIACTVRNLNGKILGVIPQKIYDRNLYSNHPDELLVTQTMDERKAIMRDRAEAFIALPGGFGTLEEILEVITLKQLDYHRKPIVFLNSNGFFDDLFTQFEKSYSEHFAKENYRKLYHISNSPEETIDFIVNYQYEDLGPKWFIVPNKA
jgi:cytokinin riboside 5'-monophosphate phosphoribohydrolase